MRRFKETKINPLDFKPNVAIGMGFPFIDDGITFFKLNYTTKDQIKDTIIGTLASILSFSSVYKEGTIIIAMAYNEDKIKISSRIAGRNIKSGRNLKKLLSSITKDIGGQCGGHKMAAGCTIDKIDEEKFIELIKKKLEFEVVKV